MEECTERAAMPEAPQDSFMQRDLEAVQREGKNGGRPVARTGIDGKVYNFVGAGSEESESGESVTKQLEVAKQAKKALKGKKEKSKKNKKKEDKKKRKKEKKKEKSKKKSKKKASSTS